MTLTQILTAIREEIGEPTEGYWKDTQLTRYVNRGLRDLNSVARAVGTSSLAFAADEYSKPLPADYLEEWVVKWVSGTTVSFLSAMQSGVITDVTTKGTPTGYIITPATIDIWPVPSGAGTLTLLYFQKFADLVNTSDVPALDANYHDLLVWFGAALAKQFAGEIEGPKFMDQYNAGKVELMAERMKATVISQGTVNILTREDEDVFSPLER